MFTARVHLEDLAVDPQLLYDGNQRLSKFTYVQRILTLNKSAVLMLHNLEQFVLNAKEEHVDLVGGNKEALQAALQTLQRMLSAPVWTSAAGEDPRLLEMLQAKKKRFSSGSGCWLKVCWTTNTIAVYGINRAAAIECIDRMRVQLHEKRVSEKVREEQLKAQQPPPTSIGMEEFRDYVQQTTGCQVLLTRDAGGKIVISLSGTDAECMNAQHVVTQLLHQRPGSDFQVLPGPGPDSSQPRPAAPVAAKSTHPSPPAPLLDRKPPQASDDIFKVPKTPSPLQLHNLKSVTAPDRLSQQFRDSQPRDLQSQSLQSLQSLHSLDGSATPACMSDVHSQNDPVMDVAMKITSNAKKGDVKWFMDLLVQMAEHRVDPFNVVEIVEVHRNLL